MNKREDSETAPVRPGEELPLVRLLPWLRQRLEGLEGRVMLRQYSGGKANLTYLLTAEGGTAYVLRRPPLGTLAASAHDMDREHRILKNLWRAYPLAPRSYLLCQDTSVIGSAFHVMERRKGVGIRSVQEKILLSDPSVAQGIAEMLIDVLAELHLADPAVAGLEDLGRPEGFLSRQVEGWTRRWTQASDGSSPDAGPLIAWIHEKQPLSRHLGLVHNDFKLDNLLVCSDKLITATAVLDWDMCTRGDVLCDLGTLLNYCVTVTDAPFCRLAMGRDPEMPGFPSRPAMIERYAARTGFDLSSLIWYRVFAAFRTAVILQQIYRRWLDGETADPRFQVLGQRIAALLRMAEVIRP